VKGEGGMVMAQTPESTEYDGMPRKRHRYRHGRFCAVSKRDASQTARLRVNTRLGLTTFPVLLAGCAAP